MLLLKRSVAYPIISGQHIGVVFYNVQCSNVLPRLSFQCGYYLIPKNNSEIYFLNILSEIYFQKHTCDLQRIIGYLAEAYIETHKVQFDSTW